MPRLDSSTNRVFQSIFSPRYTVRDAERDYLNAAQAGDLLEIISCVVDKNVNINCQNYMGKSALELAVENEHLAIIQYLLSKTSLETAQNALLVAVHKGHVQICEMLLEHPLFKQQAAYLESGEGIYRNGVENYRFAMDVSPIVLAALTNNYYIVQLLLSRGARITSPHDYFCECTECSNMRRYDLVKYSRSRLYTFRALASPAYLTLSNEDPILAAFQLSHELEKLLPVENEYRSEYRELSDKCKDYAVEFLDLCRTNQEVVAILNGEKDDQPLGSFFKRLTVDQDLFDDGVDQLDNGLSRLKMALHYEQKRFIAHAACQRQLTLLWYSGVPWMQHRSSSFMLCCMPFFILGFPMLSMCYLLLPCNNKFSKIMRSPFVKFLNHNCSYFIFLILIFSATFVKGSAWALVVCPGLDQNDLNVFIHSVISMTLFLYILGMFWYECSQVLTTGLREHFKDWWNWIDMTLISFYFTSYALNMVALLRNMDVHCKPFPSQDCVTLKCDYDKLYPACGNMSHNMVHTHLTPPNPPDPRHVADVFYAMANVFSFARTAYLLPANEYLGPLQISYGKMLQDGLKSLVVIGLVFVTFMVGLTSLYQINECENEYFTSPLKTFKSLFWATFGMGNSEAPLINEKYSNANLVNSYHNKMFILTEIMGYILYSFYIIAAVIVLLNMLIAMMSNTFEKIYNDSDVEWKFARAQLWMTYVKEENALPPPFNLLPSIGTLLRFMRRAFKKYCCRRQCCERFYPETNIPRHYRNRKFAIDEGVASPTESEYKKILSRLVRRYIHAKLYDNFELDVNEDGDIGQQARPPEEHEVVDSSVFLDITSLRESTWKMTDDLTCLKNNIVESMKHLRQQNDQLNVDIYSMKSNETDLKKDVGDLKEQMAELQSQMSMLITLVKNDFQNSISSNGYRKRRSTRSEFECEDERL